VHILETDNNYILELFSKSMLVGQFHCNWKGLSVKWTLSSTCIRRILSKKWLVGRFVAIHFWKFLKLVCCVC